MNRVTSGVLRTALRVVALSTLGFTLAAVGCGGGDSTGDQPVIESDSGAGQGGTAGQGGLDANPDKVGDSANVDSPDAKDVSTEGTGDAGFDVSTEITSDAVDASHDDTGLDGDAALEGGDEQLPCDQIPESCNGVDDNCNGAKDEGDPGGGLNCDVPAKVGECALGTTHCSNGSLKCVQNNPATAEICDGKDNNCDGQIDNNPTDTGAACLTTKPGICTAGSLKCVSGALDCVQNLQPTNEICNGLDDDCNGTVDDGFPGSGQPCTVAGQNPNTPCAQGQTNCFGGQNGCTQVVFPSSELCDGKDNDCNGTIDDPAIVNGLVCNTQLPGICAFGKTQCSGGTSTCIPDVQPGSVVEVCDGKDNNCNGQVDDVANIKLECATKYSNAQNVSTWDCTSGACEVSACVGLFRDCDGSPTNGCEVNSAGDVNQCGQCGKVCSGANGTPSCVAGQCQIACHAGFGNCDGIADNGCEKPLTNDVSNCGGCGNMCDSSTGTPSCSNGVCSIVCNAGLGNCDGNAQNGCETTTSSDPNHCGNCSTVCPSAGGTASCANGQCGITCNGGFGNCDGNAANGCETNLTSTPGHCGTCATVCSSNGGTASCANGQCGITCNGGFGNCDGNVSNGCETTLNQINNCGACAQTCSLPNALPTCATGTCNISSCNAGFGNCDNNTSTGCEVNLQNNINNCGGCGAPCSSVNGTAGCNAGTCSIVCNPNFANCDGTVSNGCEVNLLSSVGNCGSCGLLCNLPNAVSTCGSGSCQVQSCNANYSNCNGSAGDGCEINISNNPGNCGGCGIGCSGNNGAPGCAGGTCTIACNGGFGNCDGNAQSNGCETNLLNNNANCGFCGNACGGGKSCINGSCISPVPAGCLATAVPGIAICISNNKVNTYGTAADCASCTEKGLTNACLDAASCLQGWTNAIIEQLYLLRTGMTCTAQTDQTGYCGWGEIMTANYQSAGNCPTPQDCTTGLNWANCATGVGGFDAYIYGVCNY